MPAALTYPGVYIEEVPSGVRTITGVATSITAFVGFARRGPVNEPIRVQSFAEFERTFGSLWDLSTMSYAVQQYFLNGGKDALIVRCARLTDPTPAKRAKKSTASVGAPTALGLEAANVGLWGDELRVRIDHAIKTRSSRVSSPRSCSTCRSSTVRHGPWSPSAT